MTLCVVGAGLPRTGTHSLRIALEHLLGGPSYHMSVIPGHPFDLGMEWNQVLAGNLPDWEQLFAGYVTALDWPASMFWRELSEAYPDALVLLSVRDSAETWWQSTDATILPVARMALTPDWNEGRGLVDLLQRFTGREQWDDPALLMAAYLVRNNLAALQAAFRLTSSMATMYIPSIIHCQSRVRSNAVDGCYQRPVRFYKPDRSCPTSYLGAVFCG